MFDLDKLQEIYHVLSKNKLRTFLTAFGVFWGIFMLIVMLGAGNGLKNGVMLGFGDLATNSVFIWTQATTMPYKGLPRARYYNFANSDIESLRKNIPEIQWIAPRLEAGGFRGGDNVVRGIKTGAFSIYGDYPEIFLINSVNLLSGRYLNKNDLAEKRKVVVIGRQVYNVLFAQGENAIEQYIKIRGVYFKVVGVFSSKKSGEEAENENQSIYLPFTTLQSTYNYGSVVGWFSITSKPNIPVAVVEKKAIDLLKRNHSVAPDDNQAVGHFNLQKEFEKMTGLFMGINGLIWIVGIGTLLAGVIGVSNIMLIVVKERTKEIGVQRAIGATPFMIIKQIVIESIILTTIAGYSGLVVGVGIVELINRSLPPANSNTMFYNPEVNFSIAVTALVVLIISGAFAGLIPARKAVAVKPIEALRYE